MKSNIKGSGRNSGRTINVIMGRPKTPMIDRIATQAWFNALMNASELTNAYEVAKKYDESYESKRFEKYARGSIRPSFSTLQLIDKKLAKNFGVKVRMVFDDGPEGVPLWDAMSGNFELLWDIIYKTSPSLKTMRATHEERVQQFMDSLFSQPLEFPSENTSTSEGGKSKSANSELDILHERITEVKETYLRKIDNLESECSNILINQVDMIAPGSAEAELIRLEQKRRLHRLSHELKRHDAFMRNVRKHPNTIQADLRRHFNASLRNGNIINFTFQQLAATIALWRISVLVSDSVDRLDTLMTVLLDEVIADMLEPYGVGQKVIETLKAMQATYHRSLYP